MSKERGKSSVRPFPEAHDALGLLQHHGIVVAVCSNLAQSYGARVRSLFPDLDGYAYSYEMSVLKSESGINSETPHSLIFHNLHIW